MRRTYYVARCGREYAARGYETGMGRALITVEDVGHRDVIRASTPAGLMVGGLGGAYTGFEAVPVEEVVDRKFGDPAPWPDPSEVWPD